MSDEARIQRILRRQTRAHVLEQARRRQDAFYALAEKCESPIERMLLAPLMFIEPRCLAPRYGGPCDPPQEAQLFVQEKVAGYRIDFTYIVRPPREPLAIKIAIECDGHDFHASKEQRGHDAERGNVLAGAGYTLLRFTGTQIHADPEACAQGVSDAVDRLYAARIHQAVDAAHNDEASA